MQCNSLIFTCGWSRTKQTTHQYHKAFCCVVLCTYMFVSRPPILSPLFTFASLIACLMHSFTVCVMHGWCAFVLKPLRLTNDRSEWRSKNRAWRVARDDQARPIVCILDSASNEMRQRFNCIHVRACMDVWMCVCVCFSRNLDKCIPLFLVLRNQQ